VILDVVYLRQDINREAMKEERNEINVSLFILKFFYISIHY